jgi:UDP-N-acetylglucosamine 2-epimerase (non-hydrolysing)
VTSNRSDQPGTSNGGHRDHRGGNRSLAGLDPDDLELEDQIVELVDSEEERHPSTSVPEVVDLPHLYPARAQAVGSQVVVPVVVGTRPEAIKLVPIILALRESELYRPIVISTGQHHRMVQEIFSLAGITTDVTLWAGVRRELNERVTSVMSRFEDFFIEWFGIPPETIEPRDVLTGRFPAAVLVHGDTSSAMGSALAAFHLRIPVMHVEAGLRTGGLNLTPFPEELNRQLISCMACLHFAPTAKNMESLIREDVPVEQIFVTGNTGIDALRWASAIDRPFEDRALQALHDSDERIVVVTAHRRENWATGLDAIAIGVARLARAHGDVRFVIPMHPNPLVREKLSGPLRELPNVLLTEPLGYVGFARLLGRCHMVITDSGGIQEEAPSLGKPVLVTRDTTERNEGVEEGTLLLVGTDSDRIAAEGGRLLSDPAAYAQMRDAQNPYGDGHAAKRIVGALEHLVLGGDPPIPFGAGFTRRAVTRAAGYAGPLEPLETVLAQIAEQESLAAAEEPEAADPWML